MKFTGHERDLGSLAGAGDDLDYMHARFFAPMFSRFLSPDPVDSARRAQPQSWNRYTYALNNPTRFIDPDGRTEREGVEAGIIVNRSSEVIWIAGDVGDTTYVIPLQPGESSTTYFVDADAIIIDPGEVTSKGAVLGPSIEGQDSGAIKIGIGSAEVQNAGPMELEIDRSAGYGVSWFVGRAGFLDVKEAQRENRDWVMPGDRASAEDKKRALQRLMEERKKKKEEEEKKKNEANKKKSTG
jgi:RHS repeat-associated protein